MTKCCMYVFALTLEEVAKGLVKNNPERLYYIARDDDGYCPHLDRTTYRCLMPYQRPLRHRKNACSVPKIDQA